MATTMNSFPSTNRAAIIGCLRWPDLYRATWQATDACLWTLEELQKRNVLRIGWKVSRQLNLVLRPFGIAPCGHQTTITSALARVFELQLRYLCRIPPEEMEEELALIVNQAKAWEVG